MPDEKEKAIATKEASGFAQLQNVLEPKKAEIQKALGKALSADTFLRIAYTSIQHNPKLMKADPASMFLAIMDAAAYGLAPNSLTNEGHLVPFWSNKKKCFEVVFMPGYRGLLKMVYNTGEFLAAEVRRVYKKDRFSIQYGTNPNISHTPALTDPGEFIGAYAVLCFKDGSRVFEFLSAEAALIHAVKYSKSQKDGKLFGPWKDNFESMVMKTVLKMPIKYVAVATRNEKMERLHEAVGHDDRMEVRMAGGTMDPITMPQRKVEAAGDDGGADPNTIIEVEGGVSGGNTFCPVCEGTGNDPASTIDDVFPCRECDGDGVVPIKEGV
jgi:recombination protein RecT